MKLSSKSRSDHAPADVMTVRTVNSTTLQTPQHHMQEPEVLSTLIGDIYDAALDASLWVPVLGKARDFVGGMAAALYCKDAVAKSGQVFYQDGGIGSDFTRLYFDKYVKLDPTTTAQVLADVGQTVATENIMPYGEFVETRFYREWVQPQGVVDCANHVLDKSPTGAVLFGVFRHERHGLVDDEMRRRLRLIVPHLRRAVLVGRAIDLNTATTARFVDCLDNLSAGVFFVAATGSIVHANASGHAMLESADLLCAVDGRLVASDADSDQALQETLAAAVKGDSAVGTRGISQPLLTRRDSERYVAHVMPLPYGARRQAASYYAAAAALFVQKVALQTPSAPEAIAKTYKLTPSELRVLLAIVHVGGVPETAEALGVAESTVKTHLRRLFDKTGSNRQADLVKLMAGFSSPLSQSRP
jgi:DNA-binding CsgD family transcriptional regulator